MDLEWREPWYATTDEALVKELRHEMAPGHVLEGVTDFVAIARRQDRDDVLFGLPDGRVAKVHLTYSSRREWDSYFPSTEIYPDLAHFVTKVMNRDAKQSRLSS